MNDWLQLGWTWREVLGLVGLAALAIALALSCGDVRLRELPEPDAGERVTTRPQPDTSTPVAAAPLGPCDGGIPDTAPCHVDCRTGLVNPAPPLACWGGQVGADLPYTSRVAPCAPGALQCVATVDAPICLGAVYPAAQQCGGDVSCGTAPTLRAGAGDVLVLTEAPSVEADDTQRMLVAALLLRWAAAHPESGLRFGLALYGDAAVELVVPFGAPANVATALLALAPGTQEGWETGVGALCWAAQSAPWSATDRTVLLVTEDGPDTTLVCSLGSMRVVALTDGGDVVYWAAVSRSVVNLDSAAATLDDALAGAGCGQ